MLDEARIQKLVKRIEKLLEQYKISEDISYTVQEKDGIYQSVIRYQKNGKWEQLWVSTGLKTEKGNLRNAKKIADETADIFIKTVKEKGNDKLQITNIFDLQALAELNTTNFNPNKKTKADWDFYEYMEYWLEKIIINSVARDTYNGYKGIVKGRLKDYFTMKEHKKTVKELTSEDLDDFYNYLRENNLKNGTIDHYNDNISSAFNFLLRKKIVRYNPTDQINPIVVPVVESPTYTKDDIDKLLKKLRGEIIELPTLFDIYYGLRRSEIFGLRDFVFDFKKDNFTINHVALQLYGKEHKEKVYFEDRTKSKKGSRTFPLFPVVKEAVLRRLYQIERNKVLFGDSYNHRYDNYICVKDNGDFISPGYFTQRFKKIVKRYNLKKITPHGLRHSNATLLHLEGVDIRDLQDWLGHENISSTNRYTRSDYKKQMATAKVVEKIFSDTDENKKASPKRYIVKKKNTHIAV